jgi:hypothetical protein
MLTFLSPLFDRFQTATQAAIRAAEGPFVMNVAGHPRGVFEMKRMTGPVRNNMTLPAG